MRRRALIRDMLNGFYWEESQCGESCHDFNVLGDGIS